MDLKESIRKYALQNAVQFKGRANPGAIIGKLMQENPDVKKDMKSAAKQINEVVKEVNSLSPEEQKEELLKLLPDYFEDQKEQKKQRQEKEKELPELKNAVMGKVVTRIAPEPSKYNHLGHAMSFLINYMYSQKYEGKCIIRFDDTNPEKESQEFVEAMQSDVIDYLGIKADKTVFASDYTDDLIDKAEKLIAEGKAYTCNCAQKDMSLGRREMKDCEHREKNSDVVLSEWKEMKEGKKEDTVLRLKIDMKHKNAVMRDPVIFRIINTPHYRQGDKYKVWPMYDFECAILEGELGVTHVNRSNEFDSRVELQKYIRDLFGLPHVEVRQYARFTVEGSVTQGREIRALVESGEYIGWDDPRLITLRALKRRGIVKEAYYELAKVIGMSKTNSLLDFSVIAAINRKLLDESASRFFFIGDYKKIVVKDAPEQKLELNLHPENKKGGRKFNTNTKFYISEKDFDEIKDGELVRLMDCLNFMKKGNSFEFISTDLKEFKNTGKKIIHWLPVDEAVDAEVLMPDNTLKKGFAEKTIKTIKKGDVIQFERFGFCRLDSKNTFWYGHR